jgi:hypothetical protein
MKGKAFLLTLALSTAIFVGCTKTEPTETPATEPAKTEETTKEETTDEVAAASIDIKDEAVFEKSIGTEGKWIIATLNDLTFDKELVLEGEFKNGKKDEKTGEEQIQRKIAPYTQDENHKVLERFTVTAPKLTIKSPNAKFQAGKFVGDIYVEASNFELKDAEVEGNVYFMNEEAKSTFIIDDVTKVSGVQELKK